MVQITDKLIAHRGASAYAPENTMAAFNKAFMQGCRFLEFDVMLSADGEPFIFHDESLKRTSNGRGMFGMVEAAYIHSLDAGMWFSKHFKGEKIPHLKDVLQWMVFAGVSANIEIKPFADRWEQTTICVLSHLNRYWPRSREFPLISSFSREALQLCQSLAPELPLGLLLHSWDAQWNEIANELQCYSVHVNKQILTKERAESIKNAGYKLFAYTINNKRQAKKMFTWGVDAIFSDYPDLLQT